jgi:hypothetical protein
MTVKFLAAAFALALLPTAANAQGERNVTGDAVIGTHDVQSSAEYRTSAGDHVVTFLTRLIVPDFNDRRPPVASADNPELIGRRPGASNPAWNR